MNKIKINELKNLLDTITRDRNAAEIKACDAESENGNSFKEKLNI